MTVTPLYQPHDPRHIVLEAQESDREDIIVDLRADLLTHLSNGLTEITRAAAVLDDLRGPGIYDVDLAEGRDGRDVAVRTDSILREIRAAYAVLQMNFAGEGPR